MFLYNDKRFRYYLFLFSTSTESIFLRVRCRILLLILSYFSLMVMSCDVYYLCVLSDKHINFCLRTDSLYATIIEIYNCFPFQLSSKNSITQLPIFWKAILFMHVPSTNPRTLSFSSPLLNLILYRLLKKSPEFPNLVSFITIRLIINIFMKQATIWSLHSLS